MKDSLNKMFQHLHNQIHIFFLNKCRQNDREDILFLMFYQCVEMIVLETMNILTKV